MTRDRLPLMSADAATSYAALRRVRDTPIVATMLSTRLMPLIF